jgi:D-glycero-D-manno-heptose 1,7-bisphosphate phosphatase
MRPLRKLGARGFTLFIVSNQPSYAKGKTTLENIRAIAQAVEDQLRADGVVLREAYYCYHHPRGIVPAYTGACPCRKPGTHFLERAATRHGVDLARSWMLGDRDTDVECGQRAGCRTILIAHPRAGSHQGATRPDYVARDLAEAASFILAETVVASGGATIEGRR